MMEFFPSRFSPSRLTIARERRAMTKRALAEVCTLTAGAITQFESGESTPSETTIKRIAFALNFPLTWFASPEIDLIPSSSPSFRARRSMSAALRLKSVRSGDLAASILLPDMNQRFRLPPTDVPDLSGYSPEEAALILRRAWKLGEGPLPSIVPLLESRGIFVFYTSETNSCLDAWSLWWNKKPFIMLNRVKREGERERFDASHEIGHLVLHQHEKRLEGRELEDQANRFAAAFLVPESMFRIECPRVPDLRQFLRMKGRWGISVQALMYGGHKMGILSRHHYDMAYKEMSRRNWRRGEPNSIPRSISKVHKYAVENMVQKGISPQQYADLLSLPQDQLYEMMPISTQYSSFVPATSPVLKPDFNTSVTNNKPSLKFVQSN